ncbi:MAG: hypothetical protein FWF81_01185 [Defluviitaleaceae bacterium]|nr:hypothetical protein [Defluviitaleaceae bacterium]
MENYKTRLKKEWEKFRSMTFAEKRWYIWEYYKVHIGILALIVFVIGSFVNTRFINPPPEEYLYIAWVGIPVFEYQLREMSYELSVITDNPERQEVVVSDYTATGNRQMDEAIRIRFMAFLQLGSIDAMITTREGLYAAEGERFIRPAEGVLEYLEVATERLVSNEYQQIIAISLENSPFFQQFDIEPYDLYLCVIINASRFYEISKALEVILYGA